MKNEELIEYLSKFPPEDEVYVSIPQSYDIRYEQVKTIIGVSHDGVEQGCLFIDVE